MLVCHHLCILAITNFVYQLRVCTVFVKASASLSDWYQWFYDNTLLLHSLLLTKFIHLIVLFVNKIACWFRRSNNWTITLNQIDYYYYFCFSCEETDEMRWACAVRCFLQCPFCIKFFSYNVLKFQLCPTWYRQNSNSAIKASVKLLNTVLHKLSTHP